MDDRLEPLAVPEGRSLRDVALSVAFVALLALPGLALVAGLRPENIELRAPAAFPEVALERVGDAAMYAQADRFLADAVPIRTTAVGIRAFVDYTVLGGSTNPDVVVGRDGWLFGRDELDPICEQTIAETLAQVDRSAAAAAKLGIAFRYLIAPDKHVIYPDRVAPGGPAWTSCTDEGRPQVRAGMAARPGMTVDVWDVVARAAAASEEAVYYATDTHWKPVAALAAARALVESLAPGTWDDAEVVIAGRDARVGDLSRFMGVPTPEEAAVVKARPDVKVKRATVDVSVHTENAKDIPWYTVEAGARVVPGRTLVIYNSFFARNIALIAPWFAESVWVHAEDLRQHPELFAELPEFDSIVVQRVERSAYARDTWSLLAPFLAAGE